MGNIYQTSTSTIVATGTTSVQHGLSTERPAQKLPEQPCLIEGTGPHGRLRSILLHPSHPNLDHYVNASPLSTRGWGLQERALLPGILHCTYHGAFWECSKLKASDFAPNGIHEEDFEHRQNADEYTHVSGGVVPFSTPIFSTGLHWFRG
jgi:hypothetical protein